MKTISLDIQPQHRFTCMAANEPRFLHQPENIVRELNAQAALSDRRLLVKNTGLAADTFCHIRIKIDARREHQMYPDRSLFGTCANGCRSKELFSGLPLPADYDHEIEINGDFRHGVCFHDTKETHSTGLMEWLHANDADTVILGGLATEETIFHTAKQLRWYNADLHIIVNIAACCGYAPESTLKTIAQMKRLGITTVTHATEIAALLNSRLQKVS